MRVLAVVVALVATGMVISAVLAVTQGFSRAALAALSGIEVTVTALLVLPWFTVFARRAADRFSRGDAAERAWSVLSATSILLVVGQVCSYTPAAVELGSVEPYALLVGQVFPAIFRIALWWALWRMRRAYSATGIDFRLRPFDYTVSAGVVVLALVLVIRRDVLFAYWATDTVFSDTLRMAMTASQVVNFILYPAVFSVSLAMSRYAVQMGGGLVSRAWFGVALYGLLQPVHATIIALLWPVCGPLAAVALDNFVVLAAFTALAYGPMFQVEATEVSRT